MILSSSNVNKIKEYKSYIPNLEVIQGKDLPEVKSDSKTVIIYKSFDMGPSFLVEDTILEVNGKEVVDIRWKINELKEGDKALWITRIAYNNGDSIVVYKGVIEGVITKNKIVKGFGFDPYFIPKGSKKTLTELEDEKQKYSARYLAIKNLLNKNIEFQVKVADISPWKGDYQH